MKKIQALIAFYGGCLILLLTGYMHLFIYMHRFDFEINQGWNWILYLFSLCGLFSALFGGLYLYTEPDKQKNDIDNNPNK